MENRVLDQRLIAGAKDLGLAITDGAVRQLALLRDELLRWNQRVNLTAIREPEGVVEKHLLDSLAIAPDLEQAGSLLDLGSGAGFPGIPLKIQLPLLHVTLAESVGKKVGFQKHVIAALGLTGIEARHVRLQGNPEGEGLSLADVVVARAFMEPEELLPLARRYIKPGGRALVMYGRPMDDSTVAAHGVGAGLRLTSRREYRLPSGQTRTIANFSFA